MTKFETLLFQLTIFLIPTNLAYHFIVPQSYISGILSDYLIPKIYLSDIPILILLLIWFTKLLFKRQKLLKKLKNSKLFLLLVACYLLVGLRGLLSVNPIAAIWMWLKLTQLICFYFWIKNHAIDNFIALPLSLALVFQSLLGFYQFISQSSLVGYPFLGETTLQISQNIAKTNWFGQLRILPYGTTPHPNVLAGFLTLGLITLYLLTRGTRQQPLYQKLILLVTWSVSLVTLFLTQAVFAWIALVVSLLLIGLSTNSGKLISKLLITIIVLVGFYFVLNPKYLPFDSSSIHRRLLLNQYALAMYKDNPFWGIGLNNFTAVLPQYGELPGTTRFLQPVHNIYLLWLTETGLLGTIPLIYLFWLKIKRFKYVNWPLAIPLIQILLIGLADHYPLTLQPGQLLLVLSIVLASAPHQNPINKTAD